MRNRVLALAAFLFIAAVAPLPNHPLSGTQSALAQTGFVDIDGNPHAANIEAIAAAGITSGCDDTGTRYCPNGGVTRGQMATFLARALGLDLSGATSGQFIDVSGTHETSIAAVAAAGITLGCNTDGTLFCPDTVVTRAQMASFMARALDLAPAPNPFVDAVGNTHEASIGAIAATGVTAGCDATGTRYCPGEAVRRDQMASFLSRALGLAEQPPTQNPPGPPDPGSQGVPGLNRQVVDFGTMAVGAGASTSETLVLSNGGVASFTVTAVSISGGQAVDFALVSDTGQASLGPGATRVLGVTFDPVSSSPSSRSATLVVETDAGTVEADLSGVASDAPAGNQVPVVANPGSQANDVGDLVSLQVVATDGDGEPLTFDADALPTGLSISSTGTITGTIAESGTWNPVVSASDGTDEGTATFTWQVSSVEPPAGFDLQLDRFYLSQAVPAADSAQSAGDRVEVVAGRAGLVRAFVSASEGNDAAPTVTLFWQSGSSSGSVVLSGPGSVPTSPSEAALGDTFTALLDASVITSDVEVYVEVDPNDVIDEADEGNNRYPSSGWLDLNAVVVPTLEVTLVPITYLGETPTLSDPSSWLDDTLRLLPVADYDVIVRSSPLVVSASSFDWVGVLSDVYDLRTGDGSSRLYHGIVDPQYSSGVAGIGYIGAPAAISWSNPGADGVVAHEIGHNLTLEHAPCGTSGDGDFPYGDGSTGVWGYDLIGGGLKDPGTYYDFMSYCGPEWISDYHFQKALDFRSATFGYSLEVGAGQATLMVSGTVDADGGVALAPLTTIDAPASLPTIGPYTLTARDAAGAVLFSTAFAAHRAEVLEIVDGQPTASAIDEASIPAAFSFAIPVDEADVEAIASIEVSLAGAPRLTVDVAGIPAR